MCQRRFISCDRCPTLVGVLMVGRLCMCRSKGYTGSLWTFCSILLWTQLLWKQSPCLKLLSLQAVLIPLYCPVNRGLPVGGMSQFTAVWLNWARINSVTVFIRISLKLQLCLIPTQQAAKPFPKAILKMCPDCRELGVLSDTVTTSGQAFLFGAMKMF